MAEMNPLRRRMIEDMQVRNLSPVTQRCYVHAVAKFTQHFNRCKRPTPPSSAPSSARAASPIGRRARSRARTRSRGPRGRLRCRRAICRARRRRRQEKDKQAARQDHAADGLRDVNFAPFGSVSLLSSARVGFRWHNAPRSCCSANASGFNALFSSSHSEHFRSSG